MLLVLVNSIGRLTDRPNRQRMCKCKRIYEYDIRCHRHFETTNLLLLSFSHYNICTRRVPFNLRPQHFGHYIYSYRSDQPIPETVSTFKRLVWPYMHQPVPVLLSKQCVRGGGRNSHVLHFKYKRKKYVQLLDLPHYIHFSMDIIQIQTWRQWQLWAICFHVIFHNGIYGIGMQ